MILHLEQDIFKDAITATAQHLSIREVYIEKDYWVTWILKNLAQSDFKNETIFKGGTSLSKAFGCIDRFSEDIDLAIITNNRTNNQIKRLITTIQKHITKDLEEINIEGITSKGSKFRKTVHQYHKVSENILFGQASDKLLVEINAFAIPHPNEARKIETYIAQFLRETNNEKIISQYQLETIEVLCLNIERTFTEKIMGLIRASYYDNPINELKQKIRHIYDIERMLSIENIKVFLASEAFFEMLEKVKHDDASNHEFGGDWLTKKWHQCILFSNIVNTWQKLKHTYLNEFATLVYGDLPDSEEIITTLQIISERLRIFDKQK
ncbi:MAG: nucleotidyl transferase AbiEii/AbiGii toxin family protein [Chitinophagales bacterium]